jgi:protocatechuate 3,4-dioxygenase beta subunit
MSNEGKSDSTSKAMTRRMILRTFGVAFTTAPFAYLYGCSSGDSTTSTGTGGAGGAGGAGGTTTTTTATSTSTGSAGAWATGGTKSMTGTYADPFTKSLGSTCDLYCQSTLGPCYAKTEERKDISEGHDGLPVRLAFLVVDDACKPVVGATVDIWHCGPEGLYSGDDASDFCTSGDATARAARWFRGVQTTDAKGRVDFDTCFPGWYSSRSIHVHFTIRINGVEYITSQLFFDDALDDEIVGSQPLYDTRGKRDTLNTTDNVIGGEADLSKYTFETEKMPDGAMLAWKTLVLRSDLKTALCTAQGKGGMMGGPPDGGMGGPPPDGGMGGP